MIRDAGREDAGAIFRLERLCFPDAWSEKVLTEGIACPYDSYLVMEEEGCLLGYGVLRTLMDESEIHRVAVRPDVRRQGYARELLDQMAARAREKQAASIILEVRSLNHAAVSLYKSFGFQEEGRRREYFQNPADDAILMRLTLA